MTEPQIIDNFIGGTFLPPKKSQYLDVSSPSDNIVIAKVAVSELDDVQHAVQVAAAAQVQWGVRTLQSRAAVLLQYYSLMQNHMDELANLIVLENGKNKSEALADIAKGNETVLHAISLPAVAAGRILTVSTGISCQESRKPLGVVASIVPFNFPYMVPFWTIPIALMMGNTVILKPSEKVPLTMHRVAQLFQQAGLPDGCLNLVQGTKTAVESLLQHQQVKAVSFVGSSPVAQLVSEQCRRLYKKCLALGGAKNHLCVLDDCPVDSTIRDVTVSFCGCAGQRCMAASVLLLLPSAKFILDQVVECAAALEAGTDPGQVGPVIDAQSLSKIHKYIEYALEDGAEVLLDGRSWHRERGNWIGPTILLHKNKTDRTLCEEVFGPVLSVYICQDYNEMIEIENASPFGNAAAVYTTSATAADWFSERFEAAMIGVNVGIPVPREPFSFGGYYSSKSKFGDCDITGDGGVEFFSQRIKITKKWPALAPVTSSSTDRANFAGTM